MKTENIKDLCDMLDDCEREAMDVMFQLVERYKGQKYRKNFKKVSEEIEQLEIECSSAHKRAQDIIENRLGENLANQPAVIQKHSESHREIVQEKLLQSASYHPVLNNNVREHLSARYSVQENSVLSYRSRYLEAIEKSHYPNIFWR